MTRLLAFSLLLVVLCTAPARAAGISLRWTNCVDDAGTPNTAFACDTNTGSRSLVTSFVLASAFPGCRSVSGLLDVIPADLTLPAWWDFRNCRSGSLRQDRSTVGPVGCTFAGGGCSSSGIRSIVLGAAGPNTERVDFVIGGCTVPGDLGAGPEYIGPVLAMNFARTVGTPSCGGCNIGVCLVLKQLTLATTATGPSLTLGDPGIPPGGNVATWQGVGLGPGGVCQGATPTRRTVWGEVKALYR